MNQPTDNPGERIAAIFERVCANGLRRGSVAGASDDQIDQMAAEQGVDRVPEAVREVLRIMGVRSGLWLAGTAFGVEAMTAERKRHVVATLTNLEHELADPRGLLALTAHQGYAYHVVDGADLDQDDPPVWDVVEGDGARRAWDSVSDWFAGTAPNVADLRDMLEMMEEMGKRPPKWAEFVEPRRS
ncbi:hypothetical protein SAMN05216188_11777 [Lentzea xinjiangensis]|uniref:Uncharacterized protein n=1 Tax=Lentzea xinjiangensis TaxID=402600 RepID=A0A1H9SZX2_9PSEU|nr:SMI1/KNR4 family protein [Lentzea xinjiangensis]SER90525.1 hypothetical protein SAMN05216188_11777 [Lentzea xinjiangensis]